MKILITLPEHGNKGVSLEVNESQIEATFDGFANQFLKPCFAQLLNEIRENG